FPVTLSSGENLNNIDFGLSIPNPGILQFSNTTFNVAENIPTATVTINRIGGSEGVVSANINLSNGTASQGVDYGNPIPNLVFFADGETQQTVTIPISDDAIVEETETVNLSLTNATSDATIGQPATAILEIIDDDVTPPPPPPLPPISPFSTGKLSFEEFSNFAPVSSIRVNTPQGNASLLFSANTVALESLPKGGQGRFSGAPSNNTVIAYDIPDQKSGLDAIVIDLTDIISRVGEISSGNLSFEYASPNVSHQVRFLGRERLVIPEATEILNTTPGGATDFSVFVPEDIFIPENTRFIAIGSESTEIGIDHLQLTLQPGVSDRSSSQIDSLTTGGNIDNLEVVEINHDLMLVSPSFSEDNLLGQTAITNSNNLFDDLLNNMFFASDII
ncbi:MAG: Calx-beta domain-containing protein, partial [Microcoleaceae cyanobacterium]